MARDNFNKEVRYQIGAKVNFLCSKPDCRKFTQGPQVSHLKPKNLGKASHITAASKKGPRYDENISKEERGSESNGIWLCAIHADEVDVDKERYSPELLRQWKRETEQFVHEHRDVCLGPIFANRGLQSYETYFRDQLEVSGSSAYPFFSNPFFGRENELRLLRAFFENDHETLQVICAFGGFGKTRLCIEFFKWIQLEKNEQWKAVVLRSNQTSIQVISEWILAESKNLILLVDDCHSDQDLEKVNELQHFSRSHGSQKQIKVLATMRTPFWLSWKKSGRNYLEQSTALELKKLGPDDTAQMFRSLLNFGLDEQNLEILIEQSRGVPFVIWCLSTTIKRGNQNRLVSDQTFVSQAQKYLQEIRESVSKSTCKPIDIVKKILDLLAMIGPISQIIEALPKIADFLGAKIEDCEEIINHFVDSGILIEHPQLVIKPDPLRDLLVQNQLGTKSWFNGIVGSIFLSEWRANVFSNLAMVEESYYPAVKSNLADFLRQLDSKPIQVTTAKLILETISNLATSFPDLAISVIEKFVHLLPLENAFEAERSPFWSGDTPNLKEIEDRVVQLLKLLSSQIDFQQSFDLSLQLAKITDRDHLLWFCFGFSKNDFWGASPNERQLLLADAVISRIGDTEEKSQDILITTLCDLLNVSFEEVVFSQYPQSWNRRESVIFETENIKLIRTKSVTGLIDWFLHKNSIEQQRERILKKLLSIPRQIFAWSKKAEHSGKTIHAEQEQLLIFDFLLRHITSNCPLSHLALIQQACMDVQDESHGYPHLQKWREIQQAIDELVDPKVKLGLLLGVGFGYHRQEDFRQRFEVLLAGYRDAELFALDLAQLNNQLHDGLPYLLWAFDHFASSHTNWVFNVLKSLQLNAPGLNIAHGWRMLAFVRFYSPQFEENYFQLLGDALLSNNPEWIDSIVRIYAWLTPEQTQQLSQRDLRFIVGVFELNLETTHKNLAHAAPRFICVDSKATFDLLSQILSNFDRRYQEDLFMVLLEAIPESKTTCLHNTIKLIEDTANYMNLLSDRSWRVLNFLEEQLGFQKMFLFVLEWLKKKNENETEYSWADFDLGSSYHRTHDSEDARQERFVIAVGWYFSKDSERFSKDKRDSLVQFFRPLRNLTSRMGAFLMELLEVHKAEYDFILSMTSFLDKFEDQTEAFVDVLISILNLSSGFKSKEKDLIGKKCLLLFNTGSGSRSAWEPFGEDLVRKNILQHGLENNNLTPFARDFLAKQLQQVENSIRKYTPSDDEKWQASF